MSVGWNVPEVMWEGAGRRGKRRVGNSHGYTHNICYAMAHVLNCVWAYKPYGEPAVRLGLPYIIGRPHAESAAILRISQQRKQRQGCIHSGATISCLDLSIERHHAHLSRAPF